MTTTEKSGAGASGATGNDPESAAEEGRITDEDIERDDCMESETDE